MHICMIYLEKISSNLFDVQNDDVDLITGEDRPFGDTTQDKQLSKDVQKGDV